MGYGYIRYDSNCWPYPVDAYIPVIIHRPTIHGPDVFCERSQQIFNLPSWPTTEFDWALNGDPDHPALVHTQSRHEIIVKDLPPGTYHLSVSFRNTLLIADNCRGGAQRTFTVESKPTIQTTDPLVFCAGGQKVFTSNTPVKWEIRLGKTIKHSAHATITPYRFEEGGTYVVTAERNGCISDPILIEVIPQPEITGSISGPQTVCLNVPYTYSISENEPGAIYSWTVSGGTVIGSNAGTQVDVFFTSANATVNVVKQYVYKGVTCTSQPVSYSVSQLVLNPVIINNSGLTQFCPSTDYTFTADLNGVVADHISWELTPSNFGNIVQGINSNTVKIALNEVSNTTAGNLTLVVTKCGVEVTETYAVNLIPEINITIGAVGAICPDTDIIVPVTISPAVPANSATYWAFEYNGVQDGPTIPFVAGSTTYTHTIPQLFSPDTDEVGGVLTVKLVNPYGCTTNVAAYQNVTVLPKNTIELYKISGGNRICQPSGPITLRATASTGVTEYTQYEWYYDANSTPEFVTSIPELTLTDTDPPGNYYVQVTDINGCVITSNSITIYGCTGSGNPGEGEEDEDDDGECNLSFNGTPTLNYLWTECDKVTVTASYSSPSDIDYVSWSQSQPGFTLLTYSDNHATYQITRAGIHKVRLTANYQDCNHGFTKNIEIIKNYESILRYAVTCGANGNYTIELKNNTKLFNCTINSSDIQFYDMTGGTPVLVPGSPGQTVTIPNKTAGTYTYKMVLNNTDNTEPYVCEPQVTIVIDSPPATNFTLDSTEYCAEEPILLTIPGTYNSKYRYEWHFTGTHYVAGAANSYINIADQGLKQITLKIINEYGCEFESAPVDVTINKAEFTGGIDPADPDFCELDALPLKFKLTNPSNPAPTDIIWMRDDQPVHTGATYLPTQSGSYWAVLTNAEGCKDFSLVTSPVLYKLRKPPFASINGNTSLCFGESTTLTGIYTDPAVEHRWTLNGNAISGNLGNWTNGTNHLAVTHTGTTPGTYVYAFETRRPGDAACVGSYEAVVTVHPQAVPLNIDISYTCFPGNKIDLVALGGDPDGTYNWSNGNNGMAITVYDGGAYTLTYTDPNGCSATSTVDIPKYPYEAMRVVPEGCYNICASDNAYLLGPLGTYEGYYWFRDGFTVLSQIGNDILIPPVYVTQTGTYRLDILQNGCGFVSKMPHIVVNACKTAAPGTKAAEIKAMNAMVTLTLSPNPAMDATTAAYDMGNNSQNATSITVHDVTGVQRLQQQVGGAKGNVQLNVSHLAPGTYIVSLHAHGIVVAQQKLIKK